MQSFRQAMTEEEAGRINPVVLAFLGDAVYSLCVREKLVCSGEGKVADFQRTAAKIVSAKGQSEFFFSLEQKLTDRETEIFRRGRNAKKGTKAKNASVSEYNRSTGFEAVIGYLYLTGQEERLRELLSEDSAEHYRTEPKCEEFKP